MMVIAPYEVKDTDSPIISALLKISRPNLGNDSLFLRVMSDGTMTITCYSDYAVKKFIQQWNWRVV
jgi:hypothetical protein